jgi:hypothetical protein
MGQGIEAKQARSLDAPSRLWRSAVDLLMEHQRGYFEQRRAVADA